jgi:hypothetical protein
MYAESAVRPIAKRAIVVHSEIAKTAYGLREDDDQPPAPGCSVRLQADRKVVQACRIGHRRGRSRGQRRSRGKRALQRSSFQAAFGEALGAFYTDFAEDQQTWTVVLTGLSCY